MKYKVLFICNDVGMGGATQSFVDSLQELKKVIEPVVVIPGRGEIEKCLLSLNVKYYRIFFCTDFGKKTDECEKYGNSVFCSSYDSSIQIQRIIEEEKIDLVHINSSVSSAGAIAAIRSYKPYVYHIREILEDHYNQDYYDPAFKVQLFKNAAALITISDFVKKRIFEKYDIDSIRIYNGINIDKYRLEIRKEFNNELMIAGAVTESKGQFDAVKAVKILVDEGIKDIRLNIYGWQDIKTVEQIKGYVKDHGLDGNVCLYGYKEDLPRYRKEAGYSLTTSKMEALGRATIEGMLSGQLVLGVDDGGTKELIGEDGNRGFLYHRNDVNDLADKIRMALNMPAEDKTDITKRAQEYAESQFGTKEYTDKILELYGNIISNGTDNKNEMEKDIDRRYHNLKSKGGLATIPFPFSMIDGWIDSSSFQTDMERYFLDNNIATVAFYGLGVIGKKIINKVKKINRVKALYAVDRNPDMNMEEDGLRVFKKDEAVPDVDIMLVTVFENQDPIIKWMTENKKIRAAGISKIFEAVIKRRTELNEY